MFCHSLNLTTSPLESKDALCKMSNSITATYIDVVLLKLLKVTQVSQINVLEWLQREACFVLKQWYKLMGFSITWKASTTHDAFDH